MAQMDRPVNALAYNPVQAASNLAYMQSLGRPIPQTQEEADAAIAQRLAEFQQGNWIDSTLQYAPYLMLGGAALQAGMAGAGAGGAEGGLSGMDLAADGLASGGNAYGSSLGGYAYGGADAAALGPEYGGGGMYADSTGTLGSMGQGSMGGSELATMGQYPTGTALAPTAQMSPALSSPSMWQQMGNMASSPYGMGQLASAAVGLYGNNQAVGAYQDATNQANGLAQQQLDYSKELNAPLVGLRNSVLPQINALLSNPSSITSDPGYAFGLKQGADQLNNRAAASGSYYSGGQMKAAQRYGQDYAGTKLDQSLNRLTTVAGLGQVGANNAQQGMTNGTNALAGNALNMGGARGSLYAGNAQIAGDTLGNIFNPAQYKSIWGGP